MSEKFSLESWHDKEVLCWQDTEIAEKYGGKSEIFLEIADSRIVLTELVEVDQQLQLCSLYSAPFDEPQEELNIEDEGENSEEEAEDTSSPLDFEGTAIPTVGQTEEIVVSKGKIVGTPHSLAGTLNYLLDIFNKERNKKVKQVYLLLPSGVLVNQIIELPNLSRKELKSVIETEEYVFQEKRFKGKPSIAKSLRLGEVQKGDDRAPQYLLTGMAKQSFLKYLTILKGLDFVCADISSPQLLHVYYFNDQGKNESFIFAEISDSSLRIFFFYNDVLVFIRPLNITMVENQTLFIRMIASQIEQSMLYFSQQYGDISFDRFILHDITTMEDTTEKLAADLEFPIETFNSENFTPFSDQLRDELKQRHIVLNSPLYHTVVFKERKNTIRMIPREFDDQLQKRIRYTCIGAFLSSWLIIISLFYYLLSSTVASRAQSLNEAPKRNLLADEESIMKSHIQMKKDEPIYQKRYKEVLKILDHKYVWVETFNGLLESKPKNVFFTDMSYTIGSDVETKSGKILDSKKPILGNKGSGNIKKPLKGRGKKPLKGSNTKNGFVDMKFTVNGYIDQDYQKAIPVFERLKKSLGAKFQVSNAKLTPASGKNTFVLDLKEKGARS